MEPLTAALILVAAISAGLSCVFIARNRGSINKHSRQRIKDYENDIVLLIQCLTFIPPILRPASIFTFVGAFIQSSLFTSADQYGPFIQNAQGNTWMHMNSTT